MSPAAAGSMSGTAPFACHGRSDPLKSASVRNPAALRPARAAASPRSSVAAAANAAPKAAWPSAPPCPPLAAASAARAFQIANSGSSSGTFWRFKTAAIRAAAAPAAPLSTAAGPPASWLANAVAEREMSSDHCWASAEVMSDLSDLRWATPACLTASSSMMACVCRELARIPKTP